MRNKHESLFDALPDFLPHFCRWMDAVDMFRVSPQLGGFSRLGRRMSLSDIEQMSDTDLLRVPGLGKKSLQKLRYALAEYRVFQAQYRTLIDAARTKYRQRRVNIQILGRGNCDGR